MTKARVVWIVGLLVVSVLVVLVVITAGKGYDVDIHSGRIRHEYTVLDIPVFRYTQETKFSRLLSQENIEPETPPLWKKDYSQCFFARVFFGASSPNYAFHGAHSSTEEFCVMLENYSEDMTAEERKQWILEELELLKHFDTQKFQARVADEMAKQCENAREEKATLMIFDVKKEEDFLKLDSDPNITKIVIVAEGIDTKIDKEWTGKITGRKYSTNIREIRLSPPCAGEVLPEALEPLLKLPNLTSVTVWTATVSESGKPLSREHLQVLAKIPQLQSFYCYDRVETDAWEIFNQFPKLETLRVQRDDQLLTCDFAPPCLRTLRIERARVEDIPRILACKSLENLNLEFQVKVDVSMKDIQQLCSLKKLRFLKLSGLRLLNSDKSVSFEAFQAFFSELPQLQEIQVFFQSMTPFGNWSYTTKEGHLCTPSSFDFIFRRDSPPERR